jgi:hypothetical protein
VWALDGSPHLGGHHWLTAILAGLVTFGAVWAMPNMLRGGGDPPGGS